ncbi:MAG: hypothetical protein A2513_03570 [Sulfurimonas sp. RIFOXYD12_FULL_33_39]|uniref:hypothetical protein n=1 Tax=unclassified Sulfurimonas TaxID=2623549 RepID=UPI0008BE92AC|nr:MULTISPECIES: hypothetical protein [unclassified Sulfurimonas]OHE07421.1 MAG: hypothetical protein A3G74_04870 [Sulfurimonas sp. RIFCSPLOWO2_12_FULL_34_6]OHE09219.1 MAG: hypothetical protein A2513_03570 [Sulfurimonas sp. RIFOXYD12_FULL_33_39]OHE12998.1 MAG: hypothetical protein A2530_05235 [Sulfurimonas sp. RIFOXYD2_FULL_34_21]DAB28430.1 MAG TPA: hypothetical protein CFH78_02460 [Sulfurimonas sp. UBA10385]
MKLKKIYSLLLLFAISFSVTHDYTFAILDNKHSSLKAYINELSFDTTKRGDNLCDIHFEYHISYTFPTKEPSLPIIGKEKSLFSYNGTYFSLKQFNFFKPPIA